MADVIRVDGAELARLAADLRGFDKTLLAELRREIRKAAKPALAAVKAAAPTVVRPSIVLEVPTTAKRAGAFIKAKQSRMPAGKQALPRLLEGPKAFRHPVFGTDTWVVQQPKPYLWPTVRRFAPQVEAAAARAMENAARKAGFK